MIHYSNTGPFSDNEGYGSYDADYDISTPCKSFSKRRDLSVFNMTDYRSCENCVHLTSDNRCMSVAEGVNRGGNFIS